MVDDKKIKSLNQRIQKAKDGSNLGQNKPPSPIGKAMKVVVEIVAAMAVGPVSYTHLTLPTIYSV